MSYWWCRQSQTKWSRRSNSCRLGSSCSLRGLKSWAVLFLAEQFLEPDLELKLWPRSGTTHHRGCSDLSVNYNHQHLLMLLLLSVASNNGITEAVSGLFGSLWNRFQNEEKCLCSKSTAGKQLWWIGGLFSALIPEAGLASCHGEVGLTTSDEALGREGRTGQGTGPKPALWSGPSRTADGGLCRRQPCSPDSVSRSSGINQLGFDSSQIIWLLSLPVPPVKSKLALPDGATDNAQYVPLHSTWQTGACHKMRQEGCGVVSVVP